MVTQENQQKEKNLCCHAISAVFEGEEKSVLKQKRGGRRGRRTPSEMPPIYIQGGRDDRPPAREKHSKEKNYVAAEKICGEDKNRKKLQFGSKRSEVQFDHGAEKNRKKIEFSVQARK